MPHTRSFASDNHAGIHPEILQAIGEANSGHVMAYGGDPYTESALARLGEHFGAQAEAFFVFNGTSANVLGLRALTRSHHAVICSASSHIYGSECGAPEFFTGCKLLPVAPVDGKLTISAIREALRGLGDEHHVQPKVISITQASEYGTVYRPEELRALSAFARSNGLKLHMDGARLANAAASLGVSLAAITADAGVDVLSFGGTKNGMMAGEAVVFFDRAAAQEFKYVRKQGMQLASKMRFIAAQFEALLRDGLWLRNAARANLLARRLEAGIRGVSSVRITQPVETNAVFAELSVEKAERLRQEFFFHIWDQVPGAPRCEVRWMTAYDSTEDDVDRFIQAIAGR